ncbi:uncharacterized protein [Diabrotica undecimpunctata]|uniref:uncharacterized protein n=1 Tax=Diabrotica undecimpunctata TaxID=50387 RepID=UPI003B638151
MKFTFICIVIVISCSVCACNDLDIFSGLNFDFDRPSKDVPSISDYDRPSYYTKFRYPYENVPIDDYEDTKIRELPDYDTNPEKLRNYREVIDWQRSHIHQHRPNHPHFKPKSVNPRVQYLLEKLTKNENYDIDPPNLPLLDDRRLYPFDDDLGLNFNNEKFEDGKERILDDPIFGANYRNNERLLRNDEDSEKNEERSQTMHHKVHENDNENKEFTSNRFSGVKVAEDPSEFAYLPSDSRFYKKLKSTTDVPETTIRIEKTAMLNEVPTPAVADKLLVNLRSDKDPQESRKDGIEVVPLKPGIADVDSAGVYIIAIVAGISAAATVGLIAVGIGWYNLQKHVKNASDVEYPAYGVTGPNKDISPSGDRRLAQSAQMYHYQHQKQQIIAMERAPPGDRHGSVSEAESDEENEEGDYTVYECPGLAPTGEMEVKNPLFQDDPTPAQTPATKANEEEKK